HVLHHLLSEPRGWCSRLGKYGDSRKQRGGRFLPKSPGGKIEGVDQNGDAFERLQEMLSLKDSGFRERHGTPIFDHFTREALARFRVLLERVDRAVNVERGVAFRSSHVSKADFVILIAMACQYLSDLAQQLGSLRIGEALKRARAAFARELEGFCEIQSL